MAPGRIVSRARVTLTPDAELRNADWTKTTWDLPIDNVEELREFIIKQQRITVAHFKTLPIYRFNVTKLPWLKDL